MPIHRFRRALRRLAAALPLVLPVAAAAQRSVSSTPQPPPPLPEARPGWTGQASTLALNALLGGVAGGVQRRLGGGRFADGFAAGALGGGVVYAGKRIAVERGDGAGLLGREVAAVGASMVRNAGAGRAPLERVLLPVGPLNVYVEPRSSAPVRARVNAQALAWTVYAVARPELEWDAGASLSAGAAVFRAPGHLFRGDDRGATGLGMPGTLFVAEPPGLPRAVFERTSAHERVHVLQMDQAFLFVGEPVDEWMAGQLPVLRGVRRYVDLNVVGAAGSLLLSRVKPYEDRPWEVEAAFLAR